MQSKKPWEFENLEMCGDIEWNSLIKSAKMIYLIIFAEKNIFKKIIQISRKVILSRKNDCN